LVKVAILIKCYTENPMALQKSVSKFTLLTSAIAGIVGSGWLLGPMAAAKLAGPASVMTWAIAGLLMMVVAATFILLTRVMPITGGTVRFFQLSYGHFAGFGFSWIAWLAWVAVPPIETMALIQYSSNYIPHLMTNTVSPVLTPVGVAASMLILTLITAINTYGVKIYGKVNTFVLAFKLIIPISTVIILLSSQFQVHNFYGYGGFFAEGYQSIFSALPLAGVIYSFIGFNPAIQLASESKDPKRDIPIAVFGALGLCMVIYILLQFAFVGALPSSSLLHGWHSINFAGSNGPFVGLLTGLGFILFSKALYVDAVVSPFGTAMVQSMATARLTYAMSENGYFLKGLKSINKHASPFKAMILNLMVGFTFFLPFPSWQHMVGFLVSCLVLGYVVGPMSLMIINQTSVYRSKKLIEILCLVAFYICNLMIFWSGWETIYKIIILFVIGYVLLSVKIFSKYSSVNFENLNLIRGIWVIFYIIGIGVISYLGSFGGINLLPFGFDFIVMALFTLLIYGLAKLLASITDLPKGAIGIELNNKTIKS